MFSFILHANFSLSNSNDDPNIITWPEEENAPPYYILDEPYKGAGSLQVLLRLVQKELSEYTHKTVVMPYRRRIAEIEAERQLCDIVGGNRSTKIVSSIPTSLVRVNSGVYFWPGTFSKEDEPIQDIDVNELKTLKGKSGAFLQIYGDVYPFLQNEKNNILPKVSNIFQMFLAKRVDYIFSSAEETNYYKIQKGMRETFGYKIFKDRPIVASRMRYKGEEQGQRDILVSYSYASCPNNEWGRKVIIRLNEALRKVRKMKECKDAHLKWIPDELKQQAEKAYDLFAESEVPVGSFNY